MSAQSNLLAAVADLEAAMVSLAETHAAYRAAYAAAVDARRGNRNALEALNHAAGLTRLEEELLRRLRGLGLASLVDRRATGNRGPEWVDDFGALIVANV